jgi:hypothetical protein
VVIPNDFGLADFAVRRHLSATASFCFFIANLGSKWLAFPVPRLLDATARSTEIPKASRFSAATTATGSRNEYA